jgi:exosome complex RNA-binding protein Rrp42 (RNase PH superfamily)
MDASSVEESLEHPGLSVAVNRKGEVCGFLKTGVSGMDPSAQMQMIEVGQQQARKLHAAIDAAMPVASQ